jgi:hypothetical protein
MEAVVAAAAGFLLAVLWFDLMHDVLARGTTGEIDAADLDTIGRYYRRVTTDAHPMGWLVMVAMLGALAGIVVELVAGIRLQWVAWISLVIILIPMVLVRVRTFPNAVRLGTATDDASTRSDLAPAILADHLLCLALMALLLTLQLIAAAT